MKTRPIMIQKTPKDHLTTLIQNICIQLDVTVATGSIQQAIQMHPKYPNIDNLNDILNQWGISTKKAGCSFEQLQNISKPFLVRTNHSLSPYILVTEVDTNGLTCIDTQKGKYRLNPYLFKQDWDGMVQVFDVSPQSGVKTTSRERVSLSTFIPIIAAGLLLYFGITLGNTSSITWLGLTFALYLGFRLSIFPNTVYNLKHNILPYIYAGHWSFILFGIWSNQLNSVLTCFALLSFIPLILSVLSVKQMAIESGKMAGIIQAFVLPVLLCFFSIVLLGNWTIPNITTCILSLISYGIPLIIWYSDRMKAKKIEKLEERLDKLHIYKHPLISKQLYAAGPTMHLPRSQYPIYCGEENANIQLSMVVSLTSDTSAKRFVQLKKMVEHHQGLRLSIYLLPDNTISREVMNGILTFRSNHTPEQTIELISDWFRYESKNITTFMSDILMGQIDKLRMKSIVEDQTHLIQTIKGVPVNTIVMNGKMVPEYFDWEDIEYLIKHSDLRTQNQSLTIKDKFWKEARPAFVE